MSPFPTYPSAQCYVLKLRRDGRAADARLAGRLENMRSGRQFDFGSAEELVAFLTADCNATQTKE